MQKTIYIATPVLWSEIKVMAHGNGGDDKKSISRYLVDLHLDHVQRIADAKVRDQEIADQIALIDAVSGVGSGVL